MCVMCGVCVYVYIKLMQTYQVISCESNFYVHTMEYLKRLENSHILDILNKYFKYNL